MPMRIIRNIFIAVIILSVLATGSVYLCLRSPKLLAKTLKAVADRQAGPVRLTTLQIKETKFLSPASYHINEVSAELQLSEPQAKISVTIEHLGFENLYKAIFKDENLFIKWNKVQISSDELALNVTQLSGELKSAGVDLNSATGFLKAEKINSGDYLARNVKSDVTINPQNVLLENFTADAYGGSVSGNISFVYEPEVTYHIEIDLDGIDSARLASVVALFNDLRGLISGWAKIDGDDSEIFSLSGAFNIVEGGQVRASMLAPLLQYIPASQQKTQLNALIAADGLVPLQKARIHLDSESTEKLTTQFNLSSKEYNLDLNLTVDVNVDGGLARLLDFHKN